MVAIWGNLWWEAAGQYPLDHGEILSWGLSGRRSLVGSWSSCLKCQKWLLTQGDTEGPDK